MTLGLFACQSPPKKESPIPVKVEDSGVLKSYTLEQLFDASIVLRSIIDSQKSVCGIGSKEAGHYLLGAKALLDQKIHEELPGLEASSPKEAWVSCDRTCRCSLYSSVFEQWDEKKLKLEFQKIRSEVDRKASHLTSKQNQTCATNIQWFCKSPLHIQLKKEAEESNVDEE